MPRTSSSVVINSDLHLVVVDSPSSWGAKHPGCWGPNRNLVMCGSYTFVESFSKVFCLFVLLVSYRSLASILQILCHLLFPLFLSSLSPPPNIVVTRVCVQYSCRWIYNTRCSPLAHTVRSSIIKCSA